MSEARSDEDEEVGTGARGLYVRLTNEAITVDSGLETAHERRQLQENIPNMLFGIGG